MISDSHFGCRDDIYLCPYSAVYFPVGLGMVSWVDFVLNTLHDTYHIDS